MNSLNRLEIIFLLAERQLKIDGSMSTECHSNRQKIIVRANKIIVNKNNCLQGLIVAQTGVHVTQIGQSFLL